MSAAMKKILASLGARYREDAAGERPESFGDVEGEYRALLGEVAFVDRSGLGRIDVDGPDRVEFLSRLLSNDVAGLGSDGTLEALLLTPKGMLVSPLVVVAGPDRHRLFLPGATRGEVRTKLERYVLGAGVEIADATEKHGTLGLYGPGGGAVLEDLAADPALEIVAHPVPELGVSGYHVHFPLAAAERVVAAIVGAGARPAGSAAEEAVRIRRGEARFGAEITVGMLPPEVPALARRAISYDKGCYVGQETISRLAHYGRVNRELRGFLLGGKGLPESGGEVSRAGKKVGVVTSACIPPGGVPIGLGFVHRKHFEPGTRVEVEFPGGVSLATVVLPDELDRAAG